MCDRRNPFRKYVAKVVGLLQADKECPLCHYKCVLNGKEISSTTQRSFMLFSKGKFFVSQLLLFASVSAFCFSQLLLFVFSNCFLLQCCVLNKVHCFEDTSPSQGVKRES